MTDIIEPTPIIEGDPQPVKSEPVKEGKRALPIDSSRPLSGQVDRLLKSVPSDDEKEEPKGKEVEAPKDPEAKEVDAPIEETPEEVELEDIPEETKLEPLPDWQKYIIENLPNIQVMGHEGEDGKDKVYNVKRLEELPDDFEFSSKRAELAFSAALSAQEINARDLLARYRGEEQQRSQVAFDALEATDIQTDVTSLQKQGLLPKFKYAVNDPRFNDDPAVQESNKIYDFYKKINSEYYQKYNGSGRMYRVSYEDAAYRYYALNPKEVTQEVKQAIEKKEEKSPQQVQREKVASKVSAPQGASAEGKRRALRPGTSIDQVYQAYKRGII
jgi:hypothetical protein